MRLVRKSVESLAAYVPGEQPRDTQIIKLNTNENPYPPSPRVAEALARFDPMRLARYPDPVSQDLRAELAALHGCAPRQVFVGNGSDEVLALCTRAFVEDGGSVGYFEPSYSLYPVLCDIRGAERRPVALDAQFAWAMPDGYTASLFFLANPNAPTSLLHPRERVEAFCETFPGAVVLDEAYADFASAHHMDLAVRRPNVLAVRTLSKSYSLAGLRVGYAVGAQPLVDALFKVKDSYNLDALAQALALEAVRDQAWMRANVERVLRTRARMAAGLSAAGFQVYPSETNFLWVRPGRGSAREVFDRLRERHVLVRYFAGPRTGDHLRITVGTEAQADRLLDAVRSIVREERTT
jgi:histidinol-phosphate aminotransferase